MNETLEKSKLALKQYLSGWLGKSLHYSLVLRNEVEAYVTQEGIEKGQNEGHVCILKHIN